MEPVSHNISDPLMKTVIKYRFYPSIVVIRKIVTRVPFGFSQVECNGILKDINNFKTNRATQSTDITTNLLRKILIFLEIVIIAFPIPFLET